MLSGLAGIAQNYLNWQRQALAILSIATSVGPTLLDGIRAPVVNLEGLAASARASASVPVVVGENMAGRVNPYAESIGAETIDDWLGGRNWDQELNEQFISDMKAQNRQIIDLGPDFERRSLGVPPSSVYGSERQQMLNYANYERVYQRFGKYSGGVPGFDF